MLHAGLDLSRRKVDVCLLNDRGEQLDQLAVALDVDCCERSRDVSTTFTHSRSAPSSSR